MVLALPHPWTHLRSRMECRYICKLIYRVCGLRLQLQRRELISSTIIQFCSILSLIYLLNTVCAVTAREACRVRAVMPYVVCVRDCSRLSVPASIDFAQRLAVAALPAVPQFSGLFSVDHEMFV